MIFLPGHGARDGRWDPGAISPLGWIEADFVRAVAVAAVGVRPAEHVIVSQGSYSERGREGARLRPGAPVVQLHADAVADEIGPDRATVFWWPQNPSGEALARAAAEALAPVLPWPVKALEARADVSWHAGARSCLRAVAQTSILIECGYTDGAQGRRLLPGLAAPIGVALGGIRV